MRAARSADDRLRLLTVPHVDRVAPAADLPAGALWRLAAPESVRSFSAACYFAARELQDTLKVPMGLVAAAWGGSAAEAWTAEGGLRAAGGFDDRLDLLRLYREDETAANQRMGRLWEDWWRTHARAGTEPWQPEPARTGEWADVPEPMRNWKTWGVPLLATPRRHGVVPTHRHADARTGVARRHALARRHRRGRPDLGERPPHPQHLRLGHGSHVCPPRGPPSRRRERASSSTC